MTKEIDDFDGGAATLQLAHQLKEIAVSKAMLNGGDPASALFGASFRVLQDDHGKDGWLPIAKKWLQTLIASEGAPTAYN